MASGTVDTICVVDGTFSVVVATLWVDDTSVVKGNIWVATGIVWVVVGTVWVGSTI